jgi:hypothetical protein
MISVNHYAKLLLFIEDTYLFGLANSVIIHILIFYHIQIVVLHFPVLGFVINVANYNLIFLAEVARKIIVWTIIKFNKLLDESICQKYDDLTRLPSAC